MPTSSRAEETLQDVVIKIVTLKGSLNRPNSITEEQIAEADASTASSRSDICELFTNVKTLPAQKHPPLKDNIFEQAATVVLDHSASERFVHKPTGPQALSQQCKGNSFNTVQTKTVLGSVSEMDNAASPSIMPCPPSPRINTLHGLGGRLCASCFVL